MIRKLIRKVTQRNRYEPARSYSQCGEDLILEFLLRGILNQKLTYLDIGAHDPIQLSNTYRSYTQGSHGVCVEPNAALAAKIRRTRPRDHVLLAGLAASSSKTTYFQLEPDTLSTFSREAAEAYEKEGHAIVAELVVDLLAINDVLADECERCPDLVSLDIEGGELELLQAWDFSRFRPLAFCVETLTYSKNRTGTKVRPVIDLLIDRGYWVAADTYINTIFIDGEVWSGEGLI